jgi:hypothetical protein
MSQATLLVMAAGIGSRYGGLKQMDPIGPHGELIIDYSVYDALRAGFDRVVFVIREDVETAFRERVERNVESRCETVYVLQNLDDLPAGFQVPAGREKPWGTGHATLACRNVVKTPFAAINADDFYGPSSYEVLHRFLLNAPGTFDYCMVGFLLRNTVTKHGYVSRGVCAVSPDGYLQEIREVTHIQEFDGIIKYRDDGGRWVPLAGDTIASMNMWGFMPSLFPQLEARFIQFLNANQANLHNAEFYLPDQVGEMVKEGVATVTVLSTPQRWFGVTYQEDKLQVQRAIRELIRHGVYPEKLWG